MSRDLKYLIFCTIIAICIGVAESYAHVFLTEPTKTNCILKMLIYNKGSNYKSGAINECKKTNPATREQKRQLKTK